ncbi:MAG: hypothetical protein NTW87_11965 [Planctomycetota bacterium]|nr:hypothetical protein [Planctomycetota bacterium]
MIEEWDLLNVRRFLNAAEHIPAPEVKRILCETMRNFERAPGDFEDADFLPCLLDALREWER